jgi:MFS family permease
MYGLDVNAVNVAISSLQRELNASEAALALIIGGYVFAYAAGLVSGGRLGDLLGYRCMFLIGTAGFTAASMLCAMAQNPLELVGARLLQGLAASGMVPQVLALITVTFSARDRSRALSWLAVTGGLSGVCGQVFGGLLLAANVCDLGWRVIFLVNVPIGALVFALALRFLPSVALGRRPRLDLTGAIGISGSLGLALVPLVLGRDLGWPLWSWISLGASVPAMILTVAWERRLSSAGGDPVVQLTLFHSRIYRLGLAVNAAFMVFFTSNIFLLSLFLQNGLGYSSLHAGLVFAPNALLTMVASLSTRRIAAKYSVRLLTVGCFVTGLSVGSLAVALNLCGGTMDEQWLIASLALTGFGNGLILPSLISVPLSGVPSADAGAASGTLSTTQQFAGVLGVATVGSLFFATLGANPTRVSYANAGELALWVGLIVIVAMTLLIRILARVMGVLSADTTAPCVEIK